MMRRVIKWAEKEVGKSKEAILLRQANNQLPNPKDDAQLTSAEQRRVNEHKWIKVKKTRKTNRNNLVSEEPAPVQCSNEYEVLKDVTRNSTPQEECGNNEREFLQFSKVTDEVEPKSTRKIRKQDVYKKWNVCN